MPAEHRSHVLSRVVCLLEPERVRILESLLIFLRELAKHSDKTLMNSHNLAIVFAPNILRSGTDNPGQVITDAKATLEIVNLLLVDPSITAIRVDEVIKSPKPLSGYDEPTQPAPLSAKHQEFRKTMQENYQAIRKDSHRKLEQASRKSRISQSEFHKKMEVLSQKILEGEIDPAMFDEAALKFMDPQIIAQFSGQDQPMLTGHRANRKERNANRNFVLTISPQAMNEASEGDFLSPSSLMPASERSSHDDESHTDSQMESTLSDTSDTAETQSGPGSGELTSPRSGGLPRTTPSLRRAPSQNSTTIEVGVQRTRSNHLTKSAQNSTNAAPAPTSPLGLGSHRPKGGALDANSISGAIAATATLVTAQEWHRTSHRNSDPVLMLSPRSAPLSGQSDPILESDPVSPRLETTEEEEDLDDIMGDLLGPYQPESTNGTASPTPRRSDSKSAPQAQPSTSTVAGNGTSSVNETETAALVTLELIELMLGNSLLPEIVVPAEDDEEDEEGATSLSEEEVETATTPTFPTTGLFSSPLIASSTRINNQTDTRTNSFTDINNILNSN